MALAALQVHNGTTWVDCPGDATNGLDVDVTRMVPGTGTTALGKAEDAAHASGDTGVQVLAVRNDSNAALSGTDLDYTPISVDSAGNPQCDVLTVGGQTPTYGAGAVAAGTPRVTHASDDPVVTALQLLDDAVIADDAAFTPATTKVHMAGFTADETATDSVDEGDGGAARMTLDRKQIVTDLPHTAGGLSMSKTISAASTNSTNVKGSAGQVYVIVCTNINAAVRYLKLYDKATAPTVGTDTPVWTLAIPGNTAGAGFVVPIDKGLTFTLGIGFGLTTGVADADTGAVSANEHVVNLGYK